MALPEYAITSQPLGGLDAKRWAALTGPATRLAILCHGFSETPEHWSGFVGRAAGLLPSTAFTAVAAPERMPQNPNARRWWDYGDKRPGIAETAVRRCAALLSDFVERELRSLGLSPADSVLVGFSQGAMVALHLGLHMAPPPAGILSFAGRLVVTDPPNDTMARPSVLLVHGSTDIHVPPSECPRAADFLRDWGVPVETLLLDGVGHVLDAAGIAAGIGFVQAHG
jgi:phospholipase/carboxylesterase